MSATLPNVVYTGSYRETGGGFIAVATPDGQTIGLVEHLPKHSPTGISWGYAGSGAADCARSLLAAALGDYAKCPICQGTSKIVFGDDLEPRPADERSPGDTVTGCDCDRGLRMTPAQYQAFKFKYVAGWDEEFTITRAEIIGWCRDSWPDEPWPQVG